MNAITAPANSEPLALLWTAARALLGEMIKLFGAPSALAAHARLDRALRGALSPWVRSLEELVRKLLLAEAATQIPCTVLEPTRRRPTAALGAFARAHAAVEIAARPRTCFNLRIPRDERFVPDNRAPRIRALWGESTTATTPAPTVRASQRSSVDRLFQRFEALRLVIEKPAPYVRRLAARLARIARDQRTRAALRFVCRGADRIAPGFGDVLRSAGTLARANAEKLSDTS